MKSHQLNLPDWDLFFAVLKEGSIARVADQRGLDRSFVSRKIAGLEDSLGARLLVRNGRSIVPTQKGLEAQIALSPVVEKFKSTLAELAVSDSAQRGGVRFGAMPGFMQDHIVPMLVEFQSIYPEITFDVIADDNPLAFMKGQTDIMLYYGPVNNSNLVEHFVTRSAFIACASPRYLSVHGRPKTPKDLSEHAGIVYSGRVRMHSNILELGGSTAGFRFKSSIRFNNILSVKSAVMSGGGIALDVPLHHCFKEIVSGELVPVLDGWHIPNLDNYIASTVEAAGLKRVQLFTDWYIRRRREIEAAQKRRVQEEFGVVL